MIYLPRGGVYVKTPIGPLQFGIPPETIKDCMMLGLEIPTQFVITGEMFDRILGINVAEIEFPAYFNFFVRSHRVKLIVPADLQPCIRNVFQETLLGPRAEDFDITEDFPKGTPPDSFPNFVEEGYALDANRRTMTVDTLLDFTVFDDNLCARLDGGVNVKYSELKMEYDVRMKRTTIAKVAAKFQEPIPFDARTTQSREDGDTTTTTSPAVSEASVVSPYVPFTVPLVGVTMLGCSHGFDPMGTTTGFVVWVGRRGLMVDPPPESSRVLEHMGVPPRLVVGCVLTHCHADHDAGLFQKILNERQVQVYSTRTIMGSFLRKYSNITGFDIEFLRSLFTFVPVTIGEPVPFADATLRFFYSLHTIPTIGFELVQGSHTIAYSADTNASPELPSKLFEGGGIGAGRRDQLLSGPLTVRAAPGQKRVVLHEAGVPPIHTPMELLQSLPADIIANVYMVHVSISQIPASSNVRHLEEWDTVALDTDKQSVDKEMMRSILELIDTIPRELFTSDNIAQLMEAAQLRTFAAGDVVVAEGAVNRNLFLVAVGFVKHWDVDGIEHGYVTGDTFGEECVLMDDPPAATAAYTAMCDVVLFEVPADDFKRLTESTVYASVVRRLGSSKHHRCWPLLQRNVLTARFGQQQAADFIHDMQEVTIAPGEVLWNGHVPPCVLFLAQGAMTFIMDTCLSDSPMSRGGVTFRGKNLRPTFLELPITPGALVCDVNSVMAGEEMPFRLTNSSETEGAVAFIIPGESFAALMIKYPGIRLFFLDHYVSTHDRVL